VKETRRAEHVKTLDRWKYLQTFGLKTRKEKNLLRDVNKDGIQYSNYVNVEEIGYGDVG
jgi:hypothetical protein